MNYSQLRAFHAVATHGTFTGAARDLSVTQPAVTAQVKALESEHKVELFFRRSRGVELTETGCALLAVTTRLFGVIEEAEDLLASASSEMVGTLRVAADGPFYAMEFLAAFKSRYPRVDLKVTIGNSDLVEQRLRNFEADVAVMARRGAEDTFTTLDCGREPVVAFVGTEHPWATRASISLDELDGVEMIRRERGSRTQQVFDEACEVQGVKPRCMLELGSREAVREAVAYGLGVGVVALGEIGHDDRLQPLVIHDVTIENHEYVVCMRSREGSRLIRAFLDIAASPEPI